MSKSKKKKKGSGGASGSSSIARSRAKQVKKQDKTRDRIIAFLVAIAFWAIVFVGWKFYEAAQHEERQELARAYQTELLLQQITQALAAYAADAGGGFPRSTEATTGGVTLFEKLSIPKEGQEERYLPVWAGQISKTANDETTLIDAWGDPIQYLSPGELDEPFKLWSTGGSPAQEKVQWISVPSTP